MLFITFNMHRHHHTFSALKSAVLNFNVVNSVTPKVSSLYYFYSCAFNQNFCSIISRQFKSIFPIERLLKTGFVIKYPRLKAPSWDCGSCVLAGGRYLSAGCDHHKNEERSERSENIFQDDKYREAASFCRLRPWGFWHKWRMTTQAINLTSNQVIRYVLFVITVRALEYCLANLLRLGDCCGLRGLNGRRRKRSRRSADRRPAGHARHLRRRDSASELVGRSTLWAVDFNSGHSGDCRHHRSERPQYSVSFSSFLRLAKQFAHVHIQRRRNVRNGVTAGNTSAAKHPTNKRTAFFHGLRKVRLRHATLTHEHKHTADEHGF